jgi:hypothetical protein
LQPAGEEELDEGDIIDLSAAGPLVVEGEPEKIRRVSKKDSRGLVVTAGSDTTRSSGPRETSDKSSKTAPDTKNPAGISVDKERTAIVRISRQEEAKAREAAKNTVTTQAKDRAPPSAKPKDKSSGDRTPPVGVAVTTSTEQTPPVKSSSNTAPIDQTEAGNQGTSRTKGLSDFRIPTMVSPLVPHTAEEGDQAAWKRADDIMYAKYVQAQGQNEFLQRRLRTRAEEAEAQATRLETLTNNNTELENSNLRLSREVGELQEALASAKATARDQAKAHNKEQEKLRAELASSERAARALEAVITTYKPPAQTAEASTQTDQPSSDPKTIAADDL